MNEDNAPVEGQENANAESEELIGTTPEEVREILNLPDPEATEGEDEDDDEDNEEATESDDDNPGESGEDDDSPKDGKPEKSADEPAEKPEPTEESEEDVPTFEMEVEDANGEKFTLKPGDDLEIILNEFEPKNNGQIFAILDKFNELKSEKTRYDAEQIEKQAEQERQAEIDKINESWNNEIKALQGEKRIDVTSDGSTPKRVEEVFAFMGEENDKREKDGRPAIRSFEDALDKLELKERKEADAKKAKEEKELAKKRGGKVGGSSAPATSGNVYRGGARTIDEAARMVGLE